MVLLIVVNLTAGQGAFCCQFDPDWTDGCERVFTVGEEPFFGVFREKGNRIKRKGDKKGGSSWRFLGRSGWARRFVALKALRLESSV